MRGQCEQLLKQELQSHLECDSGFLTTTRFPLLSANHRQLFCFLLASQKSWEIEEQRKNICSLSNQLVGGKDSKQQLSLLSTTFLF